MLAKKQKSFLSASEAGSSFEPFHVGGQAATSFKSANAGASPRFVLAEEFWKALDSDPELVKELERRIDAKTQNRVEERLKALTPEWEAKGKEEGYRRGLEEATEQLSKSMEKIEEISKAVIREKVSLLRSHEGVWLQALNHLMKRFLVGNRTQLLSEVESWLEEGLSYFEQSGRVRVRLAPSDFDRLQIGTQELHKKSWEWVSDSALSEGQVHVECGDGGFLFGAPEEMEKLEVLIDRHLFGSQAK